MSSALDRMPNGLTRMQDSFVDYYLENGCNGTQAALSAGYAETSAAQRASELLKNELVLSEIANRVDRSIAAKAPVMLQVLESIATDERFSPDVRRKSAADWLNRAGHHKLKRIAAENRSGERQRTERIIEILKFLIETNSLPKEIAERLVEAQMKQRAEQLPQVIDVTPE